MKVLSLVLAAIGALSLAAPSDAATLYGSTAAGAPGRLYILNPATGAVIQDVGPLNDLTGQNYSMTGLAFHPTTGVLYGSTANDEPLTRRKLVTINPATALVTVVGLFNVGNATMGDIGFNPTTGALYGIGTSGGPHLYTINIATGQATQVGNSGVSGTEGGGIAINAAGTIYGVPNGARYGTYDAGTGLFTLITNPVEPVGGAYAALDYNGSVLYGLDLGPDSAGKPTHLVTIDPTTGTVTDIAASVTQLDAIAFRIPEPATTAMVSIWALAGLAITRRRK